MDDQNFESSSTNVAGRQANRPRQEDRNVWVLTAYGACGLALFGILAYYFSDFITR
jgi:hypothetical protein